MQLIAGHNLNQHLHKPSRQNNILDMVDYAEEELIMILKITDKIEDHKTIHYSMQTENENISSEKYNFQQSKFMCKEGCL